MMAPDQSRDQSQPHRGHSRSRSGMGSSDSTRPHGSSKTSSQKAMLSRALQKANTAVQLDNAQNFEGAREAYGEACELLQHVLQRTSADEDKRKLEAIRRTYTSRIDELDQMAPWQNIHAKALPARPGSGEYSQDQTAYRPDDSDVGDESAIIETASITKITKPEVQSSKPQQSASRPSLSVHTSGQGLLQSAFSKSPVRARSPIEDTFGRTPTAQHIVPPLSPFRSTSPFDAHADGVILPVQGNPPVAVSLRQNLRGPSGHVREDSQNSWLDPIDESDGSTGSSVHSRTSSLGYRRRRIRPGSGNTEIEFDTALDAAIEAAYDEGYEPMDMSEAGFSEDGEQIIAHALRKVELARERVRQTGREAYGAADTGFHQQKESSPPEQSDTIHSPEDFYDDNSSEDEEQLLDGMIRQYVTENASSKQYIQSSNVDYAQFGASSVSGAASNTDVATESDIPAAASGNNKTQFAFLMSGPPMPPPMQAVPDIPSHRNDRPGQSVRNRRLSGQNLKQLKIETTIPHTSQVIARPDNDGASSRQDSDTALDVADEERPSKLDLERQDSITGDVSPADLRPLESPFGTQAGTEDNALNQVASPSLERLHETLSSSAKNSKGRSMSVSNLEESSDLSPGTPSSQFFASSRAPIIPTLPTPLTTSFPGKPDTASTAGMFLFDDNFHSPISPGSPNPLSSDAPVSLEPCPTDFMLRPFWLMRCLYQTLVHPRGGYLSTKLFVPREVWRVKGVKLKNLEDKVANCDYLTAALLKLAKVDTYDADAVLEEMQALEGVLEEVQASLTRKLGNEVGVQGSGTLFKEAAGATDASTVVSVPRSASVSAKSSSSFSWRRLRSKNSAAGLAGPNGSRIVAVGPTEPVKDTASLPTLPMTPNPTSRPAKRDLSQVQFTGPNANYMGSLARLFDAAQVIDQIARQVEDPGLRHADKTQVGLELCTRHAAEFFGFYICRFALGDLNMLLEKFIKRGSEWVLT